MKYLTTIVKCLWLLNHYSNETERYQTGSDVNEIDGMNLNNVKAVTCMIKERFLSKSVYLKGEVYVFGGDDNNDYLVTSVEKYSPSTKTCNKVADMCDGRRYFCACAFMDKIVIIGGDLDEEVINSCLQFDTKDNSWKKIAGMNEARAFAACAAYRGNIIVSGGCNNDYNLLNTVESYDVITDSWSSMPYMINSHYHFK